MFQSAFFDETPAEVALSAGRGSGLREAPESLDEDVFKRRETLDLVRAFSRITDHGLPRHVLELVRWLGPGAGA